MPESLLQTKLNIPPLRPNIVLRPRLIARLNQSQQPGHKLTLVSAPAGFGKSTLVGDWARQIADGGGSLDESGETSHPSSISLNPSKVAWLSLDEGDSDPIRFLSYLITALDQAGAIRSPTSKGMLGMLRSPEPTVEDLLISLLNDIDSSPAKINLVLDDYHTIDSAPVHDALTFLIENQPAQFHLVIVTREDPHLPLARLRARRRLTEIRAVDLRFTSTDTLKLLNHVMGLDLSAKEIAELEIRTEGWVAGLQLAALALQGTLILKDSPASQRPLSTAEHSNTAEAIKSFSGSHRFVLDYLVEEVLEQQAKPVQNFLLQTAILDRMTGPLCDALTGMGNGQELLEKLEQANLFVIPLDYERRWYRYHRLLSDLLRHRLRQTQPDSLLTLHKHASRWYGQNGFPEDAIDHALKAQDYEQASGLIKDSIDSFWGRGQHHKLQHWLETLPKELVISKPHIAIYLARFQCNGGQLDAAEQTLLAAEEVADAAANNNLKTGSQKQNSYGNRELEMLRGRIAGTRALISSYLGDVPGIIRYGHLALKHLPKDDLTWRSITAMSLGNAHGFNGDMTAAYQARREAVEACEAAGDIFYVIIANLQVAITVREQGRLEETIAICRQQLTIALEFGMVQSRTVGYLSAIWGESLAELNDLDGALEHGRKGFELTASSGDLQFHGWSFICLVRILFSRGDLAKVEETIREMERLSQESHFPPWIVDQMAAWQARVWLVQNKSELATQWAADRDLDFSEETASLPKINFFSLFEYITLARLLIVEGRLEDAIGLLQHLLKAAEAGGRKSKVIEINILQALAFQANGEKEYALLALERALSLAEPEGFVRIFVDEGQPMASILQEALKRGLAPTYLRRLLLAFSSDQAVETVARPSPGDQSRLVEPLSKRELEVLELIAEGLTNREIASRLFLSLNTVKVHTRNIYGKLGVNNRMQAVARAQALKLLSLSF